MAEKRLYLGTNVCQTIPEWIHVLQPSYLLVKFILTPKVKLKLPITSDTGSVPAKVTCTSAETEVAPPLAREGH